MARRALPILIVVSLTGGCGSEPVRSTAPVRPAVERPAADPLPAGIYWTGYKTCEGCPTPAAITASLSLSIDQARARLARAPAAELAVGYPVVVHSDQIRSNAGVGILVIYGMHASAADAEAWRGYLGSREVEASVFTVEAGDQAPSKEGAKVITQTLPGGARPAYFPAHVEAAERAAYEAEQWLEPEAVAAKLEAACQIPAGSIYVAEENELEWYRWAPVMCGDERALIPWRASRLGNAVVIRRGGGYVLRQITAVECDSPTFQEWQYTRAGKSGEAGVAASDDGC